MFSTPGEQIKYLRELSGLSRSKFSQKYGISPNTLKYIENGKFLVNDNRKVFFKNIFEGLGFSFDSIPSNKNNESSFLDKISKSEINIQYEIDFFKERNPNYVLYTISNNSMYPIFCTGDIIGGSKISDVNSFPDFNGSLCIVSDEINEKFIGRTIKAKGNTIHIVSCNHNDARRVPYLEIKNVSSIAQISRHWCINNILNPVFSSEIS